MKTKAITVLLVIIGVFYTYLSANLPPVVSNVTAAQRVDGSKIVDVHYDVLDAENDSLTVVLKISVDGGSNYTIFPTPSLLSGDIGTGVNPGSARHVIWNAGADNQVFDAANFIFQVTADDGCNMVFVQGGTFNNGTSDVTVTSFYLDKYELTQAEYQAIMGSSPATGYGVGSDYPVYYVSWFNAIEYCNRRSLNEGLTPCYSYSTNGINPDNWPGGWNTNATNHSNISCNWIATGYRLPSEAEWHFAARGGNLTHNYSYSGSNIIDGVAWFNVNSDNSTHSVGTKTANELGFFDMTGNDWEFSWDIFSSNYPSGQQTNPHGAVSGSNRVELGGSWTGSAAGCPLSIRYGIDANGNGNDIGYRVCRSTDNLVLVQGGTFNNGTSEVTVSSFYLDKYELTQASYQAVMGSNPSDYANDFNKPVEQVTWFNAIEYCNRRSISEGLTPCYSYSTYGTNPDNWPGGWNSISTNHTYVECNWTANGYWLPTEAEWEFAARGGNSTHGYIYSGSNTFSEVAWNESNSGNTTHTVGTRTANELGIYDMSGNVWEWGWDIYGDYPSGAQNNPHGATIGSYRICRGGCYNNSIAGIPVYFRDYNYPTDDHRNYLGFRLCRNAL